MSNSIFVPVCPRRRMARFSASGEHYSVSILVRLIVNGLYHQCKPGKYQRTHRSEQTGTYILSLGKRLASSTESTCTDIQKVKRYLKGLFNRLAETNLSSILSSIETRRNTRTWFLSGIRWAGKNDRLYGIRLAITDSQRINNLSVRQFMTYRS